MHVESPPSPPLQTFRDHMLLSQLQNEIRSNLDDLRVIKSELVGAARLPAGITSSSHPGSEHVFGCCCHRPSFDFLFPQGTALLCRHSIHALLVSKVGRRGWALRCSTIPPSTAHSVRLDGRGCYPSSTTGIAGPYAHVNLVVPRLAVNLHLPRHYPLLQGYMVITRRLSSKHERARVGLSKFCAPILPH